MTYNDPFRNYSPQTAKTGVYQQTLLTEQPVHVSERSVQHSVAAAYGEMAIGLVVTAVVAWLSASSGLVLSFFSSAGQFGWYAVLIGQVVLAIALGAKAMRMPPALARVLFYVYAATMGFTLSTIFFIYDIGSIGIAFALTAGFFLCLTMIGLTTQRNMLKAGPVLLTALVVLLVSEFAMMLFNVSGATMILSAISLIIFAGLTVYDAQRTKVLYQRYGTNEGMIRRISILVALNLYLDFINMFMSVLQLFGSRD